MFHKTITLLQAARKWIDKKSIELQEQMFISNQLSDNSYSITSVIRDLVRIDKILKEMEIDNGKIQTNNHKNNPSNR